MIKTSEQPTAVVRERVPMANLTEFFGRAFGAVMAAAQAQHASPTGPPFALYHGMPTDTVDVEAGFPVTPDLPPDAWPFSTGHPKDWRPLFRF